MHHLIQAISDSVNRHGSEAISFLQELIGTPSPSGEEAEVAEVTAGKMREVGFNVVDIDNLNDVMGTLSGSGSGRSVLMNGHLDHVPVGDMVDPYSGKVMDGSPFSVEGEVIYGRGASDNKAAVAAMVMAGATLKDVGICLQGDLKVAAVAKEEVGGAGTKATMEESHFLGDVVIIGEATDMNPALGHRGSIQMGVVVRGHSCHASAPERGVNALYNAVDLIAKIRSELIPRLPDHPVFGRTTMAVTQIKVKPDAGNVVPEECQFNIDCRNSPDFPAKHLKQALEDIIASAREDDPQIDAFVLPSPFIDGGTGFNGFYTDPDSTPAVDEVKNAISQVLGRKPRQTTWRFATDGRFYSRMGLPVLGFGPGEERFAHTHQDHVKVADYLDSVKAYAWLACKVCGMKSS